MAERVVSGIDAVLLSPTFFDAGEAASVADDTPTLTVASAVTGGTLSAPMATSVGSGVYSATLDADTHLSTVDRLTVTWAGEVDSLERNLSQTVDVAGGFYESILGLRSISTLSDASGQPTARLRRFRSQIEDIIEEARGTAYVPRVAVDTFHLPSGATHVRLSKLHPSAILAVRYGATAQTVGDYELDYDTRRFCPSSGVFPVDTVLTVVYQHGYTTPPDLAVEACREYVRAKCHVDASNVNRNPSSVTNIATGETYRWSTADPRYGRWTGIEEVDARINMLPDERVVIG
ncbi:MAG: hypothetical protein H6515_13155 [Microthrixaceae bacterium]|nr:hypothetical protein [Microthrixaceae bacterium]